MLGANFIYLLMNKIYLQTVSSFFAVFKFTIKKTQTFNLFYKKLAKIQKLNWSKSAKI